MSRQCLTTSCNKCRFCLTSDIEETLEITLTEPVVKHSVSTDALDTLGTIIDETAGRDAIHLAVEPMKSESPLYPSQHINIENGLAVPAAAGKGIGIVDPFLNGVVFPGQMFWFVVYPRKITSLRHVWEHPAFPPSSGEVLPAPERPPVVKEVTAKDLSEKWIREFADRIPLDYIVLMNGAYDYIKRGEYLNFGELLEGEYVPEEFWDHYAVVHPDHPKPNYRGSFFSCSC